jgi:hypothetical protein
MLYLFSPVMSVKRHKTITYMHAHNFTKYLKYYSNHKNVYWIKRDFTCLGDTTVLKFHMDKGERNGSRTGNSKSLDDWIFWCFRQSRRIFTFYCKCYYNSSSIAWLIFAFAVCVVHHLFHDTSAIRKFHTCVQDRSSVWSRCGRAYAYVVPRWGQIWRWNQRNHSRLVNL